MMKALIVDDETLIREGIRAVVPWHSLGITEVFMAVSGREALGIIEQEAPDIMITDIQMADMTGLELIAKIREQQNEIRIIVLTGFDEFDYARECLRMQVQEFLLKPVDEEVLITTIRQQLQSILDSRSKEEEQIHMRRIAGTSEQSNLETWMRKLLRGEEMMEAVRDITEKYHYDPFCPMRIAILLPSLSVDGIRPGESESLSLLTIKNMLIGFLDADRRGITFTDTDGRILLALFEGEKSDELKNNIDTLIKLIQEECSVRLRIVLGNTVTGFTRLQTSYNDAMYLLHKEKDSYRTYVTSKDKKDKLDMFQEVYAEFIGKISASIGNTEKVMRIFDAFCTATNSYNITDRYVRQCCFELASTVYFSYVVEAGEQADSKLSALLNALLSAGRAENYEITKAFLENLLQVEEKDAHDMIVKVKRYIHEHLTDDVSVSGIAEYFYLSPNYFSRLFKRITGEGCNEYIVRKRIERAQYLLGTTNMKIGRIAQEVGYRDTNYFSLAFKKHTSMSPGRYRDAKR